MFMIVEDSPICDYKTTLEFLVMEFIQIHVMVNRTMTVQLT